MSKMSMSTYNEESKDCESSHQPDGGIRTGFVADACGVLKIVLVYSPQDIQEPRVFFHPSMTHQIFDDETIYGYRNLKITIFYSAYSAEHYINVEYDEEIEEDSQCSKADNIMEMLEPWFPNQVESMEKFLRLLREETKDMVFGFPVTAFKCNSLRGTKATFRIFGIHPQTNSFEYFKPLHERLQTLILFFIDAANMIDLDDEKWMMVHIYEERRCGDNVAFYPVGFCTFYRYFNYPEGTRTRISQFFIMPPYQKLGLGTRLLKATYRVIRSRVKSLVDITVELPSSVFQHMRDKVDLSQLMKRTHLSADDVLIGNGANMYKVARETLKLGKRQTYHLYQVMKAHFSLGNNVYHETFKMEVKTFCYNQLKKKYYRVRIGTDTEKIAHYKKLVDTPIESSDYLNQRYKKFIRRIRPILQYLRVKLSARY